MVVAAGDERRARRGTKRRGVKIVVTQPGFRHLVEVRRGNRPTKCGRSTEAEIRHILENAVRPQVGIGSALAAIGRSLGGVDLDLRRDASPVVPASFDA